jgi:hypothetical protein
MRAIFVCDENPAYMGFWKIQAEHMRNRFGLKSTLYFLSNNPHNLFTSDYAQVKQIPLLSSVPPIVQALFAKWYFPSHETTKERLFICDIDCILLSRKFVGFVRQHSDLSHLDIVNNESLPGYYVAGTPDQLRTFFGGDGVTFEEFCLRAMRESTHVLPEKHASRFSKEASPDWRYFGSEEHYGMKCAKAYTGKVVSLGPGGCYRICRSQNCEYSHEQLRADGYIDFHCPRPFEKYELLIRSILSRVV